MEIIDKLWYNIEIQRFTGEAAMKLCNRTHSNLFKVSSFEWKKPMQTPTDKTAINVKISKQYQSVVE